MEKFYKGKLRQIWGMRVNWPQSLSNQQTQISKAKTNILNESKWIMVLTNKIFDWHFQLNYKLLWSQGTGGFV